MLLRRPGPGGWARVDPLPELDAYKADARASAADRPPHSRLGSPVRTSDVALARPARSIDPILNPQRGPWQGTAGDASGQFTIATAHVPRHAIDDDDSAAEPTVLAADTRIPVFGEAAVGGE